MVTFLKLHQLEPRNGRWTPVLLKFVSTTLLNTVNALMRKELHRQSFEGKNSESGSADSDGVSPEIVQRMTSVLSRAARSEAQELLRSTLAELSPEDREVVVLRGIEQIPNQRAAEQLGELPGTVAMRWSRALEKLRHKLPNSIFEDLVED